MMKMIIIIIVRLKSSMNATAYQLTTDLTSTCQMIEKGRLSSQNINNDNYSNIAGFLEWDYWNKATYHPTLSLTSNVVSTLRFPAIVDFLDDPKNQ